jgi:CubicO group peptidase (beta-lactamase class C family)
VWDGPRARAARAGGAVSPALSGVTIGYAESMSPPLRAWWWGAALGVLPLAMCGRTAGRTQASAPAAFLPPASAASAPIAPPPVEPKWSAEAAIDAAFAEAIASESVPGGVVLIGRHDRVVFRRAYGFREVEPERAATTPDTVFDLASLTKPIATATSIMVLVERGAISLDDPLAKYVRECDREGKRAITLRHLLLHVSGLPADIAKEDFAHGRDEAIRRICNVSLRAAPGLGSI